MPSEVVRIESWLSSRLLGDTGSSGLFGIVNGRIYPYLIPQGVVAAGGHPAVVYSFQAGRDVQGLGTNRVMTRPLYLVKVISNGAPNAAAKSAADRIDERLTVAASAKDGYAFSGRREQSISFVEVDEATKAQYWHVGGLYRIEAYPTV